MSRCWDIMVGAFMIVASLAVQAVVIFVFLGLLCGALANQFGWKETWWIWAVEAGVAIGLNCLAFYEFRRLRVAHRMLGSGGAFFLLPRGLYRIVYGRETYFQVLDDRPGFPVLPSDGAAEAGRDSPASPTHPDH